MGVNKVTRLQNSDAVPGAAVLNKDVVHGCSHLLVGAFYLEGGIKQPAEGALIPEPYYPLPN